MTNDPVRTDHRDKEFPMTDKDFQRIADLAGRYTGIVLGDHKRDMVYGRIARRVRKLNLFSFAHYLDYLEANIAQELSSFINVITTNLTSFFRENHHFDYLEKTVLPELREKNSVAKRMRIWSAGCSSGQEPYSIAMTLLKMPMPSGWDIKILATDLDSDVLTKAKSAVYSMPDVDGLTDSIIKDFFQHSSNKKDVKVKDKVSKFIHFKRLNLLENWPMSGPFDAIFCRNVVIYFDKPTQKILFNRYADMLTVGGYLFIGHSENLNGISHRFENLGHTIYRKVC